MFTGIVEAVGVIAEVRKAAGKWTFSVRTPFGTDDIRPGDSVAVDGVCLTATTVANGLFTADASLETLRVTTLGGKNPNSKVNVERAMRSDGRFGGHMVMGHVDGIGTISGIAREGQSLRFTVEIQGEISRYIIRKGSVAIDGISLTVNDQSDNRFTVNIIPYTALNTTITEKAVRDTVNIETDIIGRYVESFISGGARRGIDRDFLREYGYMKGE